MNMNNVRFFSSWSGGKDSCLALYRAKEVGGIPEVLLTMLTESGERSRSHGLHPSVLMAQAEAMGIAWLSGSAAWDNYEDAFLSILEKLKVRGLVHGVFGDIDLEPHRQWVEKVCARQDVTPYLPLWLGERRALMDEFLAAGFTATIIAVQDEKLDRTFLGRALDSRTVDDLEAAGVDACGEEGEYHSVVTGGPLFAKPLVLKHGDIHNHDGYSFLEVTV